MKQLRVFTLTLAGLCLGALPAPAQQKAADLRFGTVGLGSAWYNYGAGMADMVQAKLPQGSSISVLPKAGGVGNLLAPVPDVDHGKSGERVDEALALLVPDIDAFAALEHERLVGQVRMVLRLVRPQVLDHFGIGHGAAPRLRSGAIVPHPRARIRGSIGGTLIEKRRRM